MNIVQLWEDTFNGIFKNELMSDAAKEKQIDAIDNLLLGKYQEKILDAELIQFE